MNRKLLVALPREDLDRLIGDGVLDKDPSPVLLRKAVATLHKFLDGDDGGWFHWVLLIPF
ncbi:MAG: hypothetical protein NW703_10195 [Nitrospiraceae bacterium]